MPATVCAPGWLSMPPVCGPARRGYALLRCAAKGRLPCLSRTGAAPVTAVFIRRPCRGVAELLREWRAGTRGRRARQLQALGGSQVDRRLRRAAARRYVLIDGWSLQVQRITLRKDPTVRTVARIRIAGFRVRGSVRGSSGFAPDVGQPGGHSGDCAPLTIARQNPPLPNRAENAANLADVRYNRRSNCIQFVQQTTGG